MDLLDRLKNNSTFVRKIILPTYQYLKLQELSGYLLLAMAVLALILTNSGAHDAFHELLHTHLGFALGEYHLDFSFKHFVNDGLMTIFFCVVGLEIKREFIVGELSTKDKAILPGIAAFGGMLMPAVLYFVFNNSGETMDGWGIPMATDIAFSITIISLLSKRVPMGLKVFLAALAIVDDLGAIIVIAVFYSTDISVAYLLYGFGIFGILLLMNFIGIKDIKWYAIVGFFLWLCFLQTGVHPTIAGVLLAFSIPFKVRNYDKKFNQLFQEVEHLSDALKETKDEKQRLMREQIIEDLQNTTTKLEAPLQNMLHALHGFSSYIIMPLFALVNAGVVVQGGTFVDEMMNPLSLGVICGLVIGKPLGIALSSYLSVKAGFAGLPTGATWRDMIGLGSLAGIGFTMSIFISELAFSTQYLKDAAKLSILFASILSGVIGYMLLRFRKPAPNSE